MNKPLKDSSKSDKKLWFKAKCYGWGWYPCSWQGALTIVLFLMVAVPVLSFALEDVNQLDTTLGLLSFLVLLAILLRICYVKGEKPCWRWGKK